MSEQDPFAGVWEFRADLSEMSGPLPLEWVQRVACEGDSLRVREEIRREGGFQATVTVEAKTDGTPYPVAGSMAADSIAYTRVDARTMKGIAWRRGVKTFEETLTIDATGRLLSMGFAIFAGERTVASGAAVFEKAADREL
jgi:hypothetical protein